MDDGEESAPVSGPTVVAEDGGDIGQADHAPRAKTDIAEIIGKLQNSIGSLADKVAGEYDEVAPDGIVALISDVTKERPLTALIAVASFAFIFGRTQGSGRRARASRRR